MTDFEAQRVHIQTRVRNYNQQYYQDNKAELSVENAARMKKWRANKKQREQYANDPKHRAKKKLSAKAWIENNHRSWLLRQIKLRAKKTGVRFNMTIDDIVIPKHCPVLGIALKRGVGHSCDNSPTVDRVNAKKGYVKGNVAVISRKANSLKGHASAAQHRRIAEWMESMS